MAAAYSVRGNADATVSTPITWAEVDSVEPADCTIATVPAERDERAGAVDAGGPDDPGGPDETGGGR